MSRVRKKPSIRIAPSTVEPATTVPGLAFAPWKKHVKWLLALWLGTLLAYSNSFQGGLVFDNSIVILKDLRIRAVTAQNLQLIWNQEYWYGNGTTGLYRPLATLSYLSNYAVLGNGTHAAGYHLVNLLLHGMNVTLAYVL